MGVGVMDVEFTVVRSDQQKLKKVYKATTSFESSFVAIVAIPAVQFGYTDLVRTLLRTVYSNPRFIAAIGR